MKIILIGFMGSGKSSIAKKLSSLLQFSIVEMDELVIQKTHTKNIHEVFEKGGELLLRETEIAIAKGYTYLEKAVISTGGGVILNKIVLDYFRERNGKIFFLDASFQTIAKRLSNDTSRPLFKNINELKTLYHFRKPLYLKYADHAVKVDKKSVEEIAEEIMGKL